MASLVNAAVHTASHLKGGYKPLNSTCSTVCGFHVYAHDLTRQVEAHHYCQPGPIPGMFQCIIFDQDEPHAKLIGIEYIIPADIYETLSEEEKKYWHSHVHEVKSGMLYTPEGPLDVDLPHMKHLINTYGKTFHTWQADKDELPLGPPQLMMSFTKDGQINQELQDQRDKRYGKSTADVKELRKGLEPTNPIAAGVDHWEHSDKVWQSSMEQVPLRKA